MTDGVLPAAARRLRVVAAFFAAARRCRVTAAFFAADDAIPNSCAAICPRPANDKDKLPGPLQRLHAARNQNAAPVNFTDCYLARRPQDASRAGDRSQAGVGTGIVECLRHSQDYFNVRHDVLRLAEVALIAFPEAHAFVTA